MNPCVGLDFNLLSRGVNNCKYPPERLILSKFSLGQIIRDNKKKPHPFAKRRGFLFIIQAKLDYLSNQIGLSIFNPLGVLGLEFISSPL